MSLTFSDLYGANGLAFLVGEDATDSTTATALKRVTNDAYISLAAIRAYWRKRSNDYTSSSSPSLPTAGNRFMDAPSDFSSPYRLGYRQSGQWIEIPLLEDDEFLMRSATASGNAGDPEYARLVYNSSGIQIELDKPISSTFISNTGTITLEYFINLTRLSSDSDEPIVPDHLRIWISKVAAFDWALSQGDNALMGNLTRRMGSSMTTTLEEARAAYRRYDLTRTGKSKKIRPEQHYAPQGGGGLFDYGMRDS